MAPNMQTRLAALTVALVICGAASAQIPPPSPAGDSRPPAVPVTLPTYRPQVSAPQSPVKSNAPLKLVADAPPNQPPSILPQPAPEPGMPAGVVDVTPHEFKGHNGFGVVTCDGCRSCDSPAAWLFSAEYLLLRPMRRADDFAIVDPRNNLTPEGRIPYIGFNMDSGVRASLGYRPAGSAWEAWFTYTHLNSGGDYSVVAPPHGLIYATQTRPGIIDDVRSAAAGQSLDLNLYDLYAGRRILSDNCGSVRLDFGFRYADIDQSQSADYFGGSANGAQVFNRVGFSGAGPTFGGEGRWNLPWGFSLFGKAHGGLIVGEFENSLRETDNGGRTVNANINEHYYMTIPVLELGTGLSWEYRNLRLSAGYEVANWVNLIDSPTFIDDFSEGKLGRRRSDLSLQGLFLQLGVAY